MDERFYGSNERNDGADSRSRISRLLSQDRGGAPVRPTYETRQPESYAPQPQTYAPQQPVQAPATYQGQGGVMIYAPSTYEDVQFLIDHLKMHEQVIVDFSTLNQASVYRILDFMSGAIYALSGSIQQISTNIFLFAPAGVTITIPQGLGGRR